MRLNSNRTRPKQLVIQVTEEEREIVHEGAKAAGLSMQAWCRAILLREASTSLTAREVSNAARERTKSAARALLDGDA